MEIAGFAMIVVPMLIFVAMFTAWPAGICFGMLGSHGAGGGYVQAACAGTLTALPPAWLFGILETPRDSLFGIALLLAVGAASGAFGWHAVTRGAGRRASATPGDGRSDADLPIPNPGHARLRSRTTRLSACIAGAGTARTA